MQFNVNDITPVDMAGFMGNSQAVKTFTIWLEKKIVSENESKMQQGGNDMLADISNASATRHKDSQVQPFIPGKSVEMTPVAKVKEESKATEEGEKTVIVCAKIRRQELTEIERLDLRIFYWAAYNGFRKILRYMIQSRNWSPFMKSYKNRSIVSGAIWGSQVETIRMILGDYKFEGVRKDQYQDFAKTLFNKDEVDNNCLHYCYMIDLPEVR